MSSPVIRFEVMLPQTQQGTSDYTAIQTFMSTIETMAKTFYYPTFRGSDQSTVFTAFFGYITAAQSAAALSALSTLNSS